MKRNIIFPPLHKIGPSSFFKTKQKSIKEWTWMKKLENSIAKRHMSLQKPYIYIYTAYTNFNHIFMMMVVVSMHWSCWFAVVIFIFHDFFLKIYSCRVKMLRFFFFNHKTQFCTSFFVYLRRFFHCLNFFLFET